MKAMQENLFFLVTGTTKERSYALGNDPQEADDDFCDYLGLVD
jgi:hypothetical protein